MTSMLQKNIIMYQIDLLIRLTVIFHSSRARGSICVNLLLIPSHEAEGARVKDRMARYIIEYAESAGSLRRDKTILEATSGNTARERREKRNMLLFRARMYINLVRTLYSNSISSISGFDIESEITFQPSIYLLSNFARESRI